MAGDDTFTEISEIYRSEKKGKLLAKLPPGFYERAESYLDEIREQHARALGQGRTTEAMMLQEQLKKLEKRLERIYEIRLRKIVIAALDTAKGGRMPDNLSHRDRMLFERVLEDIKAFGTGMRRGAEPLPERPAVEAEPEKAASAPEVGEPIPAAGAEPKDGAEPAKDVPKLTTVLVLEDMPTFVGPDSNYHLRKDDLVGIPDRIARLLASNGKVRIVGE